MVKSRGDACARRGHKYSDIDGYFVHCSYRGPTESASYWYCFAGSQKASVLARSVFHFSRQKVCNGHLGHRDDGFCSLPHDRQPQDVHGCNRARSLRRVFERVALSNRAKRRDVVDLAWRIDLNVVLASSRSMVSDKAQSTRSSSQISRCTRLPSCQVCKSHYALDRHNRARILGVAHS